MQHAIFECFGELLEAIIKEAIASGTYEGRLETLQAEKFKIIDRKTVYEHDSSGASATALTVERTDRNHPSRKPRRLHWREAMSVSRSIGNPSVRHCVSLLLG